MKYANGSGSYKSLNRKGQARHGQVILLDIATSLYNVKEVWLDYLWWIYGFWLLDAFRCSSRFSAINILSKVRNKSELFSSSLIFSSIDLRCY